MRFGVSLAVAVVALAAVSACRDRRSGSSAEGTSEKPSASPMTAPTVADGAPPGSPPPSSSVPVFQPSHLLPFAPIPAGVETPVLDDAAVLGKRLYGERALSRGRDVSCDSCHSLATAGADAHHASSTGTQKHATRRNTPTILNAAGGFAQGWDARASTIEEFLSAHLTDASVMGMPEEAELARALAAYAASFRKAFPDDKPPISAETAARALAAYATKLFARSRWDRYLGGDRSALTADEMNGVAMFVDAGCTTCHQGKYLGATQLQRLGIAKPWPSATGDAAGAGVDLGRFEVTKQEADRGMFKVPSLRNVTLTPPYLHDGSVETLEETVRLMARHQVGRELSDAQVGAIVRFLGALEGRPPATLGPR